MQYYGKNNKSLAKAVSKEELQDIIGNKKWEIVDIRMPDDFRKGHINGAKNITTQEELQSILDSGKNILLNCYSGHTVSVIGSDLVNSGYTNIYFLDEHIEDCI